MERGEFWGQQVANAKVSGLVIRAPGHPLASNRAVQDKDCDNSQSQDFTSVVKLRKPSPVPQCRSRQHISTYSLSSFLILLVGLPLDIGVHQVSNRRAHQSDETLNSKTRRMDFEYIQPTIFIMAPAIFPIQPAQLLRSKACPDSTRYAISRLRFKVPLRHDRTDTLDDFIELTAHMVSAEVDAAENKRLGVDWATRTRDDGDLGNLDIILYLCGGPGADNPPNRNPAMNQWLLENGYSILYVDYRGCGDSRPVYASAIWEKLNLRDDREIANYITCFCQDNIVRDLESIRLCLAAQVLHRPLKWTTLGQSYGGYISLTYLSMFPEGLQEVFITGGLPPCGMDLDEYFRVEYKDIVAQNKKFYATYFGAHTLVRRVLTLIKTIGPQNIKMTGRGYLTGHKLLTLGRQFGSKVGFPEVYDLLQRIKHELETTQKLSLETITDFESILHIDERPLYPILLEQTWCSGGKTRWAAERVARELEGFEYLNVREDGTYCDAADLPADEHVYFTANTYCRFHYDTHEELISLKGAAEILAEHDWECPYDYKMLAENPLSVPVYAISFQKDMHLDVGVAAETAAKVGGLKLVVDPGWHQDIRYRPAEVLENLFQVRGNTKEEPALQ